MINPRLKTYVIHVGLFVATLLTTTLAGAEWRFGSSFFAPFRPMGLSQFLLGFEYAIPFLAILTVHEFGHFFMAKYHKIRTTLPYYIPVWLGGMTTIGTMGAFIKIKDRITSRKQYFDIGIAGPLAGFILALLVLCYAFTHLPPIEYIYEIHPEYKQLGSNYAQTVFKTIQTGNIGLGDNLLFIFFKKYIADVALIPHSFEMIHYPLLLAGYLALFFTALNLIPVGQLDGGHILYALIGNRAFRVVSPVLFVSFTTWCSIGIFTLNDFASFVYIDIAQTAEFLMPILVYLYALFLAFSKIFDSRKYNIILTLAVFLFQLLVNYIFPALAGYAGFLLFMVILGRFLGIYHPETPDEHPLDIKRKILGWLALLVFVLCFSPMPFVVT